MIQFGMIVHRPSAAAYQREQHEAECKKPPEKHSVPEVSI
jgi:hypothetical protein